MSTIALAAADFAIDLGGDAPLALAALADAGIDAEVVVWDGAVDWSRYDAVVVRATWDYTRRLPRFLEWVERVSSVSRLANPAEVIRWNSDKRYLEDLRAAGVPVIETTWVGPDELATVPAWPDFVVKPAVSGAASDSARYRRGDDEAALAHVRSIQASGRWTMVQPYVGSVDTVGETGLFVFGGTVSHAVTKGGVLRPGMPPTPGVELAIDQRVTAAEPRTALLALAAHALEAVPGGAAQLLYARVDTVVAEDGSDRLIELELIEPSLFLPLAPGAAERYAGAIRDWLAAQRRGS